MTRVRHGHAPHPTNPPAYYALGGGPRPLAAAALPVNAVQFSYRARQRHLPTDDYASLLEVGKKEKFDVDAVKRRGPRIASRPAALAGRQVSASAPTRPREAGLLLELGSARPLFPDPCLETIVAGPFRQRQHQRPAAAPRKRRNSDDGCFRV
jgi:hypothetical protein